MYVLLLLSQDQQPQDWTAELGGSDAPQDAARVLCRYADFTASGLTLAAITVCNGLILSAGGTYVDSVAEILEHSVRLSIYTYESLAPVINEWLAFTGLPELADRPYAGGGTWRNGFWRTMLSNLVVGNFPRRARRSGPGRSPLSGGTKWRIHACQIW
jgi:hypothetical protein